MKVNWSPESSVKGGFDDRDIQDIHDIHEMPELQGKRKFICLRPENDSLPCKQKSVSRIFWSHANRIRYCLAGNFIKLRSVGYTTRSRLEIQPSYTPHNKKCTSKAAMYY